MKKGNFYSRERKNKIDDRAINSNDASMQAVKFGKVTEFQRRIGFARFVSRRIFSSLCHWSREGDMSFSIGWILVNPTFSERRERSSRQQGG